MTVPHYLDGYLDRMLEIQAEWQASEDADAETPT